MIRWFHNDVELKLFEMKSDLKYRLSSSNSLLLLHTSKHDHGKYRCLVENQAGSDAIDLHLEINGKKKKHLSRLFVFFSNSSFFF